MDKDYYGGNIKCLKQSTIADCEQLCQNTVGCDKYSYVTDTYNGKYGPSARRNCCLKPDAPMPLTDEKDVTSGPRVCHGKWKCDTYLQFWTASLLERVHSN